MKQNYRNYLLTSNYWLKGLWQPAVQYIYAIITHYRLYQLNKSVGRSINFILGLILPDSRVNLRKS